jgi:hypothetical protein
MTAASPRHESRDRRHAATVITTGDNTDTGQAKCALVRRSP